MKYNYHKDGTLPSDEYIWVFGSNKAGIHGAGAAKIANTIYNRPYKTPFGFYPITKIIYDNYVYSYAIPTKDEKLNVLLIEEIKIYVEQFILGTLVLSHKKFFVTAVGCGLAGYKDEEIAPLFIGANTNCSFPKQWEQHLEHFLPSSPSNTLF